MLHSRSDLTRNHISVRTVALKQMGCVTQKGKFPKTWEGAHALLIPNTYMMSAST